ncbi:hypothetical protein [Thermococcus sp.]|uniref:hypothetical protein n=1 Tax=Thermococcus sp. TaxID=35749 RepID=UPI00262EB675|nr:hypothetical protein [Thermococcus sp.]
MKWKVALSILWVMLFVATPLAYAIGSLCGPHSVLAPDEYCTFYPLVKTGEDDAIIDLSWDALGPGMSGLPTPSMVGDYYFYFKDGRLYYLGNSTGAYDLLYVFHDGLWYLSDGRVIYPEKPCIVENVTIPKDIRGELCPCSNVSIKSKSYPVILNGSTLQIVGIISASSIELPPLKNPTYTIELPENLSINLPPNVTLRAVPLGGGFLIYTHPTRFDTPLNWNGVRVLYYDGRTLEVLNFTEAFKNRLPLCETLPRKKGNVVAYEFVLGTVLLGLIIWKIREIMRR